MKYIAPSQGKKAFTCPHCGVLARQYHYSVSNPDLNGSNTYSEKDPIVSTICEHCCDFAIWLNKRLIHPSIGNAPFPNPDMPKNVKIDYEEAANISSQSPKGAAALLRLAIQKLCVHLGGKGKNINDDIAQLVKNGLPEKIQKSLDVVRVAGNNAVHPGQIDIDDPEVVGNLFVLVNVIVETMISMPTRINNLYKGLPTGALQGIKKRDSKQAKGHTQK